MNLLFLPLFIGMTGYFIAALMELRSDKPAIERFNAMLAKKWVIALAVLLMLLSWAYNVTRGI